MSNLHTTFWRISGVNLFNLCACIKTDRMNTDWCYLHWRAFFWNIVTTKCARATSFTVKGQRTANSNDKPAKELGTDDKLVNYLCYFCLLWMVLLYVLCWIKCTWEKLKLFMNKLGNKTIEKTIFKKRLMWVLKIVVLYI